MNYSRIYEQLIDRARNRVPEGYVERHHIVPRCMGGSDENSNLVALTPEEHFTAHVLLVKMYPEVHGLIKAVSKMCRGHRGKRRNKMYGWLKRRFSEEMKRSQSGSGNSQHGSFWINNGTESRKIRGEIPEGWNRGRIKKDRSRPCKLCGVTTLGTVYCHPCYVVARRSFSKSQTGKHKRCAAAEWHKTKTKEQETARRLKIGQSRLGEAGGQRGRL